MCVADRAEIAHDVLSYMVENSDGRDTLEGIVEWWLLEQKIKHSTAEVKGVLDELTLREFLLEIKTSDTRIHYSVNRFKEKEIQAFLEDKK